MKTLSKGRKAESGFTLVELAVVMIIIGLLIGGVLKGQEMIANARITSTIAQIKGIESATSTFRDMYDAMPGDLTNPSVRLAGCAGGEECSNGGDGDSIIDKGVGAVQAANDEGCTFWAMLAAADLVSGMSKDGASTAVAWGLSHPQADIGGGFTIGHSSQGFSNAAPGVMRGGHYLAIQADPATAAGIDDAAAMTASQAARIDRKMDDGMSDSGAVQPAQIDACTNAGGDAYDEAADEQDCALFIRIQS